MEKIIELKLSEEDTMKLQRVNYESLRFGENLQFMMENPDKGFSGEQLIEYTQKKAEADMKFDQYRWDLEKNISLKIYMVNATMTGKLILDSV